MVNCREFARRPLMFWLQACMVMITGIYVAKKLVNTAGDMNALLATANVIFLAFYLGYVALGRGR